MKTYLFNIESGLYEGETFEEAELLQCEEGVTAVPPPDFERGHVPVFNKTDNAWRIIPVSIARQLLGQSTKT